MGIILIILTRMVYMNSERQVNLHCLENCSPAPMALHSVHITLKGRSIFIRLTTSDGSLIKVSRSVTGTATTLYLPYIDTDGRVIHPGEYRKVIPSKMSRAKGYFFERQSSTT